MNKIPKANLKTQAEPEFDIDPVKSASQRSNIIITFRATVPTQQYGNITLEATQTIDIADGDAIDRSIETIEGLQRLKRDIAMVILPLAEAEVDRCASVLVKEAYPDSWLQRNSSLYRWLRVSEPDLIIPAMQDILASKSIPNQGLE